MYNKVLLMAQAVPEGRVFGLDAQTFNSAVIQLINAVILAAALGFLLYKPLKNFLHKRTERIQSQIDEADADMAEAKRLIAEYEKKLTDIEKERKEILEDARLKAADERKIILEEAGQEADEIRKRASERVLAEQEHIQEETRLYIIEIASLMAEKYITQTIDPKTQDRLFEETLAQMEDVQWQN